MPPKRKQAKGIAESLEPVANLPNTSSHKARAAAGRARAATRRAQYAKSTSTRRQRAKPTRSESSDGDNATATASDSESAVGPEAIDVSDEPSGASSPSPEPTRSLAQPSPFPVRVELTTSIKFYRGGKSFKLKPSNQQRVVTVTSEAHLKKLLNAPHTLDKQTTPIEGRVAFFVTEILESNYTWSFFEAEIKAGKRNSRHASYQTPLENRCPSYPFGSVNVPELIESNGADRKPMFITVTYAFKLTPVAKAQSETATRQKSSLLRDVPVATHGDPWAPIPSMPNQSYEPPHPSTSRNLTHSSMSRHPPQESASNGQQRSWRLFADISAFLQCSAGRDCHNYVGHELQFCYLEDGHHYNVTHKDICHWESAVLNNMATTMSPPHRLVAKWKAARGAKEADAETVRVRPSKRQKHGAVETNTAFNVEDEIVGVGP